MRLQFFLAAILFFMLGFVSAQAQGPPPNYSGDFWSGPALTGDWGGLRNRLAEKGVVLEMDFGSVWQGVVDPGRDRTTRWSG
jgi:porin